MQVDSLANPIAMAASKCRVFTRSLVRARGAPACHQSMILGFVNAIGLLCLLPTTSGVEPRLWPELRVSAARETYTLEDWIDVEVEIANRGRSPLFFSNELVWGLLGTLEYSVFDNRGELVRPRMVIDDGVFSFRNSDKRTFVKLSSGESIRKRRQFPVSGFVPTAGDYVLRVRYLSRSEVASFMGTPVWNRDKGPLLASLRFKVKNPH